MTANLGRLGKARVEIDVDLKKLGRDFKKVETMGIRTTKQLSGGMEKVRIGVARVRNITMLWKFAMAGTVLAVGLALKKVTAAFIEQENAERQLEARLKSTGYAAGITSGELKAMAAGLQQVTTFGDEATLVAQGLLLTFTKIGRDVFPRALETVLDMSIALGQDLKSSALQLGKALNDPILGMTALRRVGVNFDEAQVKLVKNMVAANDILGAQTFILDELQTEFGGAARAARDTFGGETKSLANAFGDTMEHIGEIIANKTRPAVVGLTESLTSLNEIFESLNVQQLPVGIRNIDQWKESLSKAQNQLENLNIELNELGKAEQILAKPPVDWSGSIFKEYNNLWDYWTRDKTALKIAETRITGIKKEIAEWEDYIKNAEEAINALGSSTEKLEGKVLPKITPEELNEHQNRLNQFAQSNKRIMDKMRKELEEDDRQYEERMREQFELREQIRTDTLVTSLRMQGEALEEATEEMSQFAVQAAHNIQDAFAEFFFDPFDKGLQGMVESFAIAMQRMAANMMAQELTQWIFPSLIKKEAHGDAFSGGNIIPMARGGVVSAPTLFPMAHGMGLMGERGAEAVMPLGRTSSGDLGVKTTGKSGGIQIINVSDSSDIENFLTSARGQEVIVNTIRRNNTQVRALL